MFVDVLYHDDEILLYAYFTESFAVNVCLILSNAFTALIDISMWFFCFSIFIWQIILIGRFLNIESDLDTWNKPLLFMVNNSYSYYIIGIIYYI